MQRLMATACDADRFDRARLAVASFRRFNPKWSIRVLDVGMTVDQASAFAAEGTEVESAPRTDFTGADFRTPWAYARCRALASVPADGTPLLWLDNATLTLGSIEPLVGRFLASGCPVGLTPEVDPRFHTLPASAGWLDDQIPAEFTDSARWSSLPNLNAGVLLARGSAAAEIGQRALERFDRLYSRCRFGEQSLLGAILYDGNVPIYAIPHRYNCPAFEPHLRHGNRPYIDPVWLGSERVTIRNFADRNGPVLDAVLEELLGWYSHRVPERGPFDVAVVIPTVMRPTLVRAVRSVFEQRFSGTIQILIGVDARVGDPAMLDELASTSPPHVRVQVVDPGYSTSAKRGGIRAAADGGGLRTALSYLSRARYVAYLDDDNWWGPDHLSSLLEAVSEHDWAYSLRWFVGPDSDEPGCVDRWESVGPESGIYRERFGGFVDPSCLLVDAVACEPALRLWCYPLPDDPSQRSADRSVFDWLRRHGAGAGTGRATAYYTLSPSDGMHAARQEWMKAAVATSFVPQFPGE